MDILDGVALMSVTVAIAATLRHGFLGFAIGVVGVWAWGGVAIELAYRFDHDRESHMIDAIWVLGGGGALLAASCCFPFLIGRIIFVAIRRRREAALNA